MNIAILKLLRQDAAKWWYHKTLRETGRAQEAALLERKMAANAARGLRFALRAGIIEWHDRTHTVLFGDDPAPELPGTQSVSWSNVHDGQWAALHLIFSRKLTKGDRCLRKTS